MPAISAVSSTKSPGHNGLWFTGADSPGFIVYSSAGSVLPAMFFVSESTVYDFTRRLPSVVSAEYADFSETESTGNEFDSCTFQNCSFSEADLSGCNFMDCKFENCNLGLAKFDGAGLKNVRFNNCKLTGVDFSYCSDFLFDVGFKGCVLNYAVFFKNSLVKSVFENCTLNETQFAESDLREAEFKSCSLSGTLFVRNNMAGADFRTAENYIIDPEINVIKGALFSLQGVAGLLFKYDIIIE